MDTNFVRAILLFDRAIGENQGSEIEKTRGH